MGYTAVNPLWYTRHMATDAVTKALLDRLSRAEGQIRALRLALESGEVEDCKAFISQIKAARSALKRTSEQYVQHHIHRCHALPEQERDAQIAEALRVLASD